MTRHWTTSYGERIPPEIHPDAHGSVLELLEGAMKRYAERPAFRCFGQTLTYADSDLATGCIATNSCNTVFEAFATDGSGNVTQWEIQIANAAGVNIFFSENVPGDGGTVMDETSGGEDNSGSVSDNPGGWMAQGNGPVPTPEPGQALLLGAGLGALTLMLAFRKRQLA